MYTNPLNWTCARSLVVSTKRFGARSYATQHAHASHGGRNRTIIAGLVGVTVPALYFYSSRTEKAYSTPHEEVKTTRPTLDPATRSKFAKEANGDGPRHVHPEHQEPEKYKPAFGQLHARKKVDGPPDGRNHKDLNDSNRHM